MTRTELIESLAARTGADKKEAKAFLEALTALVEDTIRQGGEVPLRGLGKFKVQNRKARVGRNPLTGDEIQIPAKTVVKFTLGKSLKDLIKPA
jgi:nucleoid DNA-binding protein